VTVPEMVAVMPAISRPAGKNASANSRTPNHLPILEIRIPHSRFRVHSPEQRLSEFCLTAYPIEQAYNVASILCQDVSPIVPRVPAAP
jgi:hypothetical protein